MSSALWKTSSLIQIFGNENSSLAMKQKSEIRCFLLALLPRSCELAWIPLTKSLKFIRFSDPSYP